MKKYFSLSIISLFLCIGIIDADNNLKAQTGVCIVDELEIKKNDDICSDIIKKINKSNYFEIVKKGKEDNINNEKGYWYYIKRFLQYPLKEHYEGWIFSPLLKEKQTIRVFDNLNDARIYHFEIHPLKDEIDEFFNFIINGVWERSPDYEWDGKHFAELIYNFNGYSDDNYAYIIGISDLEHGSVSYLTEFISKDVNIYQFRWTYDMYITLGGYFYIEIIEDNKICIWTTRKPKVYYIRENGG